MRNRFGRALCGLAAGVAVTTAIGMTGAGAASAAIHHAKPNATAGCADNCFDLSSYELGYDAIQNAYVPGDTGTGGKVGQKVTLKFASNSHPNEDFTDYAAFNGTLETVADFCDAWPAPQSFNPLSYVCQNYYADYVYEASWSPFGNESGLCVGVARGAVDNENVTLQNCGASDNTLWIGDAALGFGTEETTAPSARPDITGITAEDCVTPDEGYYCPWVNGGDTNFSHPLVLTVNAGSSNPANQLLVQRENLLTGGVVRDNQEFTLDLGPA
jgi:hypothetical protein